LDKEVLVADKMKAVVGHSFRRPVRTGSEHQQMVDLNSLLESVSLSQSHDKWFCNLTGDGEFRVKESWFSSISLPSKVKNMLEGVFCVAWWSIWGLRNHTIFNETPPRRSLIFDDIVSYSFIWCSSRWSGSAWKAYMNARVAGLFLLVLLEYPNGKGVVRVTSRDSI
nr:RNA-directed DNA polymerase, eukaryota [Tanacetum cinerariifolium]